MTPADSFRRVIVADAQRQGWQVFRETGTRGTGLLLVHLNDGEATVLHVDVVGDGTIPGPKAENAEQAERRAEYVRAGIKSRTVSAPSQVGEFLRDLAGETERAVSS